MTWRDRFRHLLTGPEWDGTAGTPPSGNGASSFHLFADLPPGEWTGLRVTLEVIEPPVVPELYFWALQAGFTDGRRSAGAAHLGLQWFPPHPGSTAVNWGGYGAGGDVLDGTTSRLPSSPGNPHTRDYRWRAGTPYELRIERDDAHARGGRTAWRGSVTDLERGEATVVRHLLADGHLLEGAMVWSEVFARCDHPGAAVRWSDLVATDVGGADARPSSVQVNYQSLADGGCATTDVAVDDVGIVQRTGCARCTPPGERLAFPRATEIGKDAAP